jgi:Uma2 family endonuclease
MAAMPITQHMTAAEFVAAPVPDRGRPWNLVDGEVVVNEPTRLHNRVQRNVLVALEHWTRGGPGRGSAELPADVGVDERNVFAPDVLWYSVDRLPPGDAEAPYPMPTLAVEVRSPSTWHHDVGAKKAAYERHGLPELWLVDTVACTVLVCRRARPGDPTFGIELELGEGDHLSSPLLAGFALPVSDVFRIR